MVQLKTKITTTTPSNVRLVNAILKADKMQFKRYYVEILGRHCYHVFVVPHRISYHIVNIASYLRIVLMPFPLCDSEEEMKEMVYKYCVKLPW